MTSDLDITSREGDEGSTLEVRGQLDMESSPDLKRAIDVALGKGRELRVDLSGVEYVDSSGIAVLIEGYKKALRRSKRFILVDPNPRVLAVIELSQLQDFFTFEPGRGTR